MKESIKKTYMAPETGILSLESVGSIMTNPTSQFGHTDANAGTGSFLAPGNRIEIDL